MKLRRRAREKSYDLIRREERALLTATELIGAAVEKRGMSRKELAAALGVSQSEVTQRLQGTRNLTLRTIVDMLDVLEHDLVLDAEDRLGRVAPAPARPVFGTPGRQVRFEGPSVRHQESQVAYRS